MQLYEPDLESYLSTVRYKAPRVAAEVAYALAILSKDESKKREYALLSIDLFETVHIDTLDAAAARFISINGILIPELIHEGVVKARFGID